MKGYIRSNSPSFHPNNPERYDYQFARTVVKLLARGSFFVAALIGLQVYADSGGFDPNFNNSDAPNQAVYAFGVQSDQKIVIGGNFTAVGAATRGRIARLDPYGALDPSFDPGDGADGLIRTLAVQLDGKILVGGDFTVVRGETHYRVARFNSDGTLDSDFVFPTGPNASVFALAVQTDGRILLGGQFSTVAGQPSGYLVRLMPNGAVDSTFNPFVNGPVYSLALQGDGKIVLGGDFTSAGSEQRIRVARLNTNGSADPSFNPAYGPNSTVIALGIQPDGKILIGGSFSQLNGASWWTYLARLQPDGSSDGSFAGSMNNAVYTIAVQADGKILVGGDFTAAAGQGRGRFARLRVDGSVDPSFDSGSGADSTVESVYAQPDGNILVGGYFTHINGSTLPYITRLQGISPASGGELEFGASNYTVNESDVSAVIEVRRRGKTDNSVTVSYATSNGSANAGDYLPQSGTLNFGQGETIKTFTVPMRPDSILEEDESVNLILSNPSGGAELGAQRTAVLIIENDDNPATAGVPDSAFQVGLDRGPVNAIAVQPDGKIIVAGEFSVVGNYGRWHLARLNPDGTLDLSFYSSLWTDGSINVVVAQPDGKILIGGSFTQVNGVIRNRLARFKSDGTLDFGFDPGSGPNSTVQSMLLEPDGDILVGGNFSVYSGDSRGSVVRIYSDGTLDTTYYAGVNATVYTMAFQSDGKLLIGGDFTRAGGQSRTRIARLDSDGNADPEFDPAAGADNSVFTLALQPDGKIVIGGNFGQVNGTPYWHYLARLNSNGLPDVGFNGYVDSTVWTVAIQSDGKILVGGDFTVAVGQGRNRLARLRADGTLDPSFDIGSGADGSVRKIVLQADGNLLVGGAFTRFGPLSRSYLTRIQTVNAASGGEFEFSLGNYRVSESQASAVIEVRRRGNTSGSASVSYATSNGSANAGDYVVQSGTLNFTAGQTSKTFTIPIRADTAVEDDETVNLTLSNPSSGALLGSQRTSILTIVNDDASTNPGSIDTSFTAGVADNGVNALAVQPDGKLVVAGSFSYTTDVADNSSRLRLARFNSDGTVDLDFYPSLWANSAVYTVVLQSDGRILVGGSFTQINGVTRNYLARLHADGTLDETFDPGQGPNGVVYSMVIQPDGDVLVGGGFTTYGGQSRGSLVRVYNDGSLNPNYDPQVNARIITMTAAPGGKLVIGGDFTVVGGRVRNRIARLNADGGVDLNFDPAIGPNSTVQTLALQSDGKIVIGGDFSQVDLNPGFAYFARLTADGVLDMSFAPYASPDGSVYSVVVQPDGKILAGGVFTHVAGQTENRLARFRSDGSLDPSFDTGSGANNTINSVLVQLDGNIVAGGSFSQFAGLTRWMLVRLQGLSAASGGELEFSRPIYEVSEGGQNAVIEVRRRGNTSGAVAVSYSTSNGSANAGDYTSQSGVLTFGVGQTVRTFTVPVRSDTLLEDDESVILALSNPTAGAVLGAQQTAILYILNDDTGGPVGGVDGSFNAGLNSDPSAVAVQPDGKIIAVGDFYGATEGFSRLRVARFNADGSLDSTFSPNLWANARIAAVAVQPDGRILIGGDFTVVNGINRYRVARLFSDGSLDTSFDAGNPGPNTTVSQILLDADGNLLISGAFGTINGQGYSYLARLFSDGSLDTTYYAGLNGNVNRMAFQSDGKLVIGGDFTSVGGQTRVRVARLNADGTVDLGFDPIAGPNNSVYTLDLQSGGKVVIGGAFGAVNGFGRSYIARLNADGSFDPAFATGPGPNGPVYSVTAKSDGKIYITGPFGTYDGNPQSAVARLFSDGSLDAAFAIGTGANAYVGTLAFQSDSKLIISGGFTQFDGVTRYHLARLNVGSTLVPIAFRFATAHYSNGHLAISGPSQIGQTYVLQMSQDLRTWSSLATNVAAGETLQISADAAPGATARFYRMVSPH